jgi:N-acetyl-beta-hexosaminidase
MTDIKKNCLTILFILFILNFLGIKSTYCQPEHNFKINVIPTPLETIVYDGHFEITSETQIHCNQEAVVAVDYFLDKIKTSAGIQLRVTNDSKKSIIQFVKDSILVLPGNESYTIEINANEMRISANGKAGFFYAIQTILQLLPAEVFSTDKVDSICLKLPSVFIKDVPKYPWRSFMMDSGRQFQSVKFIKRYLDYLAMLKINVFHWHLTEGQGWRIQINKYPKLTKIGSCVAKGKEQQGFYSQAEIKEIIEYAKLRFITVVPEIDLPGHSEAALIAYPEYTCFGELPETVMEYSPNLFCGGDEKTYTFIQNILDEVCELFPSPYIHLGGDEAPKDNWDSCQICQERIKQEGLKNSHELQIYFSIRLANYLKSKGKKVILWGDVIEQEGPRLPDSVIIYWWNYRKNKDLAFQNAIKNDYQIICGTNYYTYLNFPVTPWSRYKADRTFDIRTMYEKNPSDIMNPSKLVLGVGTCLWTDWHVTMNMIDKRVFPRIFVMAEQMWKSGEKIPFEDFYQRVKSQYNRLKILTINYGPAMENEIIKNFTWD